MSKTIMHKFKNFTYHNKLLAISVTTLFVIILSFIIILSSIFIVPYFEEEATQYMTKNNTTIEKSIEKINISENISLTEKNIKKFQQKLISKTPSAAYMVVNTSANHFYLYKSRKLIREGLCSTGSYILLQGEDQQKWIFRTPRGEFRIRGKTTSPVWIRPDWAFIEEGLPIPSANDDSRYEYGVLGDYALSLGFGYMIHGTLYKRFLGMPVTHGCIRLGDADLKEVYSNLDIGSKVFIF
jgi:lipoprotein-anchoring transpeptidase ErfK/SrfK